MQPSGENTAVWKDAENFKMRGKTQPHTSSQDSVWSSGGIFLCVSACPLCFAPLPSRTSLLSPSGFRHSQPLATAVAQGSGITDSSSLVIQHLSEVQLSFPYVLIRCCFLPCRKDAQAGGCRSSAWSLSQPCSHQTSEGLSEEFSLWRWQGWVWEQKP